MPKRIQRKRSKGWRMPEGAVYVGRPTKWGNPYRRGAPDIHGPRTPERCVELFRFFAASRFGTYDEKHAVYTVDWSVVLADLRGKDLACWCPLDKPCHADVLLELANR